MALVISTSSGTRKNPTRPSIFCVLFDGQRDLFLRLVVGIADIEFRRTRSVNPLIEKLIDVCVCGFFNRFGQIRRDYILAAIHFQIVFQSSIELFGAKLMAKHVQSPAAFVIGVAIELAGIVEVVTNDRFGVEIAAWRTKCARHPSDRNRPCLCRSAAPSTWFP